MSDFTVSNKRKVDAKPPAQVLAPTGIATAEAVHGDAPKKMDYPIIVLPQTTAICRFTLLMHETNAILADLRTRSESNEL